MLLEIGIQLVITLAYQRESKFRTMKQLIKIAVLFLVALVLLRSAVTAQTCAPITDTAVFGTNNVWRGYVYSGNSFTSYRGFVTEGTTSNPNFDQSFGGSNVTYATSSCSQQTENFSVKYKLTKVFAAGTYQFTVGADDGYRLSFDGGATWPVTNWAPHSYSTSTYTVALSGTYNLVLEYFENGGDNRITFNLTSVCVATGDESVYGTDNVWNGYLYQGMNFQTYRGQITEGVALDANFDESFGGDDVTKTTSSCSVRTEQFSARFRLRKTLLAGNYVFTIGGDDGYRFSLDGGVTWVINGWADQSYTVRSYTAILSGSKDMVLEYYENGGHNRISFGMSANLLPVKLTAFSGSAIADTRAQLVWKTTSEINFDRFAIQRSGDGQNFQTIGTQSGKNNNSGFVNTYSYTDQNAGSGVVYYRIALIDVDGTTTYSQIVSVTLKKIAESKLYPTIVTSATIFVESSKKADQAKFELYDMNGRLMMNKTMSLAYGKQQISLSGSGAMIVPGAYLARVSDGNEILIKQVITVK